MAEVAELGQAYVQIIPSARGIKKNIEKVMGPEAQKAAQTVGGSMGSKLGVYFKRALAAVGVGKILKDAITEGGELEQNLDGTNYVFGQFAKEIQDTAKSAYKNMGQSASEYMATANIMASLFQGSGLTQQRSLELTTKAMQRAADVASIMGIDTKMALDSIAGAAKGNFTMMDNLGVAMNATTLQAYALEKGINFKWHTASNAEKAELAMQMFFERTTQYAGNFAREAEDTLTGSLGAMQSAWKDMLGNMATGAEIKNALTNLGKSLVDFVRNMLPMLSNVVRDLPGALITVIQDAGPEFFEAGVSTIKEIANGLAAEIPNLLPKALDAVLTISNGLIQNIPMLVECAGNLIKGLAKGLIDSIPVLAAQAPKIIASIVKSLIDLRIEIIEAGIELLTSLVDALPEIIDTIVEATPEIVSSIVDSFTNNIPQLVRAGFKLFTALVEALPQIIYTIIKAIPKIISTIVETFKDNVPKIIKTGFELFTSLAKDLPQIIRNLTGKVGPIVRAIIQEFKNMGSHFFSIGRQLMQGLGNGISNAVGGIIRQAKQACQNIVGSVKDFFGVHSPSRVFEKIGMFLDMGLASGILGNIRPIAKAMDKIGEITNRSFESDFAINTVGPQSRGLSKSLKSGLIASASSTSGKIPAALTFILGGRSYKAFVEDITSSQDRTVELQLAY